MEMVPIPLGGAQVKLERIFPRQFHLIELNFPMDRSHLSGKSERDGVAGKIEFSNPKPGAV